MEDANDFIPHFSFPDYDVTVLEDATLQSTVAQLTAIDKDLSPQINYRLLGIGSGSSAFRLVSSNNVATIILDKELDRETMPASLNGIYILWVSLKTFKYDTKYRAPVIQ